MLLYRVRKMNLGSRKFAIREHFRYRRQIDLATICYETDEQQLGDEFKDGAKYHLHRFQEAVKRDLYLEVYAIEVVERWRLLVNREQQIANRIMKENRKKQAKRNRRTPLY